MVANGQSGTEASEMRAIPSGFEKAHATAESYAAAYAASISDPDTFWRTEGKRLDWIKPYTKVKNTRFDYGNVSIKWFEDGTLNASANCIDRHLARRADQTAIIWEADDPKTPRKQSSESRRSGPRPASHMPLRGSSEYK